MNSLKYEANAKTGLIVLCISAFLVPFMGSAINLALPDISATFSMKAVTLTWMATAYLISTAVFQIPFARVADILGRKKVFMTGILIFSVCSLLCGFAPSGGILIFLRFLSGIGSAMMFGTNIAILTSLFPSEQRGKALGINVAVVYAALVVGPFVGGMLTHYLGWHSIFFVSAGIGLVAFVLAKVCLNGEWIEAGGEKFDFVGAFFYGIGLSSVIYGFSSLPHVRGFITLFIGIVGMFIFAKYELKQKFPVFNLQLFSGNRVFTLSSLAALINYAATAGIAFMLSLYLQYVRGLNANHAGLILITQACVQSLFSLVAGHLSKYYEPSKMAMTGMMIIVVGLIGLVFLNVETPYWIIITILVALGIGFGIFSSPNTNVIMGSVDKKDYSAASATTGTMRLTGQAFSMGIVGMAISFNIGNRIITPDYYPAFMHSMRITFVIFSILCVLGIYASSVRVKVIGKEAK